MGVGYVDQGYTWLGWPFDLNRVARPNLTTREDDTHDSGDTGYGTVLISVSQPPHQAFLEVINLEARVPQPGQFNNSIRSDAQQCPRWKRKQVNTFGRNVLTELTSSNGVALPCQLVEQLLVDDVNLPEVGLRCVLAHQMPVLDQFTGVSISIHSHSGNECD
jgi:hypothetical protein